MALTKADALALLPDNTIGSITAADMRTVIAAIYDDGIDNVVAVGHRVDYMQQVNEAIIGSVLPWEASGTYSQRDTVLYNGAVWMALAPVTAGSPAPSPSNTDWAQLDYVGQYATLLDLEIKVHGLETRVAALEAKP